MSGIFGIVYFDGRPATNTEIAGMSAAASWRAVDGESAWIAGSAAIGHHYSRITQESVRETQPFVSEGVVASFDGRLDNRDELISRYGVSHAEISDASVAAHVYRAAGESFAGLLVGDFSIALFDTTASTLLLTRDVMGARSLYYAPLPGAIAFASEVKSLLSHRAIAARPDEDGLADLVLNGYWDGHRTCFEGVWSVPAGAVVIASASGVAVRHAWDFDEREIRYKSSDDYVEHFRVLFTRAVERRLRSAHPVAVAVSGGVDSSAIYCQAARLHRASVRGVTLAYPRGTSADEHEFVEVLRRRGLPVDDVHVNTVRWLTDVTESVARTEMPALLWNVQDALIAQARAAGCRVLLHGFFADQVLAGQSYLVDLVNEGRWATVRRHLREMQAWTTDVPPSAFTRQLASDVLRANVPPRMMQAARFFVGRRRAVRRYPPWFTPEFRERAYQRARDRSHAPPRFCTEHARECYRRARSGYYTRTVLQTSAAGLPQGIDVTYPFRDRDLVAYLMSIPGDVVSRGGVPKAVLRRAVDRIVPDEIRLRRSKGDGTPFSNDAARAEEALMLRRFGPRSLSAQAGYVDAAALRAHLPALFECKLQHHHTARLGWEIGDTLALDLWLERFCGAPS